MSQRMWLCVMTLALTKSIRFVGGLVILLCLSYGKPAVFKAELCHTKAVVLSSQPAAFFISDSIYQL